MFLFLLFFFIGLQRKLARDRWKFLVTILFFFVFSSSILNLYYAQDSFKKWQEILNKIGLTFADEIAVNFSSLFSFFFFSFSFIFFINVLRKLARDCLKFLVTFLFFFVFCFTSLIYLYYAQDGSKKWQEIFSKLGLTFQDEIVENFSSLFLFFLFYPHCSFGWGNWQKTV